MIVQTYEIPKCNCGGFRKMTDVTGVVLHSTGSTNLTSPMNWFANPKSKVSAHYIVHTDGVIAKALYQGHCLDVVMYHAGKSVGWAGSGCNRYTLGVEQVHVDQTGWWPRVQFERVCDLINLLKESLPNLHYVTRHRDIAPGRKSDPDQAFPMEELVNRTGLTWWKPAK